MSDGGGIHHVDSMSWALDELADGWTLLLTREAFFGARRFRDFVNGLDAPKARISERLGRLVRSGCMDRVAGDGDSARPEYRLAKKGRGLYPLALALLEWGSVHTAALPTELLHRPCGTALMIRCECAHCHEHIEPGSVSWSDAVASSLTADRRRRLPDVSALSKRDEPVGAAISMIGDRWSAGTVLLLLSEPMTYGALRARLGVSTNILADRLRRLVAAGIVVRPEYSRRPYRLTAAGEALAPVAYLLATWALIWAPAGVGARHAGWHSCGNPLAVIAVCASCGAPVKTADVAIVT
ncbi:MAG: helix-turn-helix domain-containing protein [Actinomycetota bacterium]